MIYRIQLQSGALIGPPFLRYVDAFNARAAGNLVGARIVEREAADRAAYEAEMAGEDEISAREDRAWAAAKAARKGKR